MCGETGLFLKKLDREKLSSYAEVIWLKIVSPPDMNPMTECRYGNENDMDMDAVIDASALSEEEVVDDAV